MLVCPLLPPFPPSSPRVRNREDLYADTCFTPMSSFRVISVVEQLSASIQAPPKSIKSTSFPITSIHHTSTHPTPAPYPHNFFLLCYRADGRSISNAPNRIPSSQPYPLRDRTVLLLRFRELLLRAEGFVGLNRTCISL